MPPSEKGTSPGRRRGQGRTNVRNLFREADARVIALADPIAQEDMNAYYRGMAGASRSARN